MKRQGINTVSIEQNDEIELKLDRDGLIEKFTNMKPGTYMNPNGSEFEAVGSLKGDNSRLYIRLHAPWSPDNINICWKLVVYNYELGNKVAHFGYEFRTMDMKIMEWFIHSNLAHMFEA